MGDIFVEIREHQQQFEHAIALLRVRIISPFLEIFNDGKSVREQPLKTGGIDRRALAAGIERLISPREGLVEKMIEAQLFACKALRDQ